MLGIVGRGVALVVVERDRSFGNIEGEVAIGAVIVLPAAMRLAEGSRRQSCSMASPMLIFDRSGSARPQTAVAISISPVNMSTAVSPAFTSMFSIWPLSP